MFTVHLYHLKMCPISVNLSGKHVTVPRSYVGKPVCKSVPHSPPSPPPPPSPTQPRVAQVLYKHIAKRSTIQV